MEQRQGDAANLIAELKGFAAPAPRDVWESVSLSDNAPVHPAQRREKYVLAATALAHRSPPSLPLLSVPQNISLSLHAGVKGHVPL